MYRSHGKMVLQRVKPMSNTIPVVTKDDSTDCRSGNPKCKLASMCSYTQISGQPAINVYTSQEAECRDVQDVPTLGPGQYDLMIIGDKPYVEDDKRDVPFQDPASGMVIEFMKKAGIDPTRTYMTKMVKCKPKPRRKPTVQEINTCRDSYLRKEIELIQPKVVMLVGAEALRAFNMNGRGSINSIRGKVFEETFAGWDDGPTFKVVPTLNPATFYYKPNEKLRVRVQHDYIVAQQLIEGKAPSGHFTPKWHLVDTPEKLDWLTQQIEQSPMIGFDTESVGLSFMKTDLLCIQIAWGWDEVAVIPVLMHDPNAPKEQQVHCVPGFGALNKELVTNFINRIFQNPNISKAAHNFKHDENFLRYNYGTILQGFRADTMVMKHLMDENPPSTLEFLCDLEFAWGDYAEARRNITGSGKKLKKSFDKVPDAILWPYGATDALGTYRLAAVYCDRLQKKHPNLWQLYLEESEPLIKSLAKAEYKGALMQMDTHTKLFDEYTLENKDLLVKMRKILWPDFNPQANPQVLKAFQNLGVADIDLEDDHNSSGYSTDKKKLTDLVDKGGKIGDLATMVMTYRNRTKMISTYLVNAANDLDIDGRLRYSWFQAGPVTGRLSCRFFHQVPKIDEKRVKEGKPVMRDLFIAPKGYRYVYGDFSQVELWIMAILSQDQEMLSILNSGGDLHAATTVEFLASVWAEYTEAMATKDKFNRTEVGKRVNFGLIYGSEGFSLVKTGKWKDAKGRERNFTWDMLNKGMTRWKKRFVGVGQFIDVIPDVVRGYGGTATNVFGRERHFGPLLNHQNDSERGKAERESVNFFIQSVASCITNRTINAVDKMLEKYGIGEDIVCLVNTVHDSVAYEVREDYVEWFKQALKAIAFQPYPQLFNNQFKMDVGIGQSWTEAELNT